MDSFHSIYSIGRKNSKRIYVVWVETEKEAADTQAGLFMARTLDEIGKNAQLKERETKLDNARKLR